MDGLEKSLDEVFVKKAPVQLPENAKKIIVQYSPYLSLILGVVSLLATLTLWRAGHAVNEAINYANSYLSVLGADSVAPKLGLFYYLALAMLAVQGLIYILAYPGLKARKKVGWNYLFYGLLLNALYAVVSLFDSYYLGASNFVMGLLSLVVGGFFLFQVRSHYLGAKTPKAATPGAAPTQKK